MKVKCTFIDMDKGAEGLTLSNIYECSEIDNEGANIVDDYGDFLFLWNGEFEVVEE